METHVLSKEDLGHHTWLISNKGHLIKIDGFHGDWIEENTYPLQEEGLMTFDEYGEPEPEYMSQGLVRVSWCDYFKRMVLEVPDSFEEGHEWLGTTIKLVRFFMWLPFDLYAFGKLHRKKTPKEVIRILNGQRRKHENNPPGSGKGEKR